MLINTSGVNERTAVQLSQHPAGAGRQSPQGPSPYATDRQTAQRGGVTCPESYSKLVPEPEQDPRNADGSSIHKAVNKYVLST